MEKQYTVKETAKLLNVHYRTVLNWYHTKFIKGIKFGKRIILIPQSEIDRIRGVN